MTDNFDKSREDGTAAAQDDTARQFLTFTIGTEEFGVDIMIVREIKGWAEITRLPNTPDFMRGVMNLRGLIIPIFDLRMRFHLGATEATSKHVIIILAVGDRNIGLLVDAVSDILDASNNDIKPAPSQEDNTDMQCVSGLISHQDRMVVLLDALKLFNSKHIESATAAA